jgi:Periplasmic binding protein
MTTRRTRLRAARGLAGSARRLSTAALAFVMAGTFAHMGAAAAATAAAATAQPFKVMLIADISESTVNFTVPEAVTAAKAALKGTGATLVVCDSKGDQNTAKACQRDAVSQKVAAVIMGYSAGAADQDVLTQAKMPVVGLSDPKQDNSYALSSGLAGFGAIGIGAGKAGCKRVGMLEVDGTDFLLDATKAGAESAGAKEVARAAVPINAPDLSPSLAKLLAAKPDCIIATLPPTAMVQAVTAVHQLAPKLPIVTLGDVLPKATRDTLGSEANNILFSTQSLIDGDSNKAALAPLRKSMAAIDKSAPVTTQALYVYVAGKMIAQAAAGITGPVDQTTLATGLSNLKTVDTGGLMHPLTVTDLPEPAFKHFINHYGLLYKITKGKLVRNGNFFDLAPILDKLPQQ